MPYSRGDMVLVFFPDSNLRTAKGRPALVIQADRLETGLPQTIVAMVTSNLTRAGYPSRVLVELATPEGQQTGLLTDSVIMTDNLVTVLDVEVARTIGVFTDMLCVDATLRNTFGL